MLSVETLVVRVDGGTETIDDVIRLADWGVLKGLINK
jgi:hypothetical protein